MAKLRNVIDTMQLPTLLVSLVTAAVALLVLAGVFGATELAVTIIIAGAVVFTQLISNAASVSKL